jgi:hypothetical protein
MVKWLNGFAASFWQLATCYRLQAISFRTFWNLFYWNLEFEFANG